MKIEIKFKKENVEKRNDELIEILFFFTKLLVLSIPMYLIIFLNIDLVFLRKLTKFFVIKVLSSLSIKTITMGDMVIAKNFMFIIGDDCTAWKGMFFLIALILSFSNRKIKHKIYGIITFIPIIFLFNIIRIISIVLIAVNIGQMYVDIIHNYVWQTSMVLFIIACWYIWIEKTKV